MPPPEADEPYYEVIGGDLKEHARHWYYAFLIADLIPTFNGPDSVLYSRELEQEMILGEYRYGSGEIYFDAARDTFFFYLIRRN